MSPSVMLAVYWIALIVSIVHGEFECVDNQCVCSNGECIKTCSDNECTNFIFICTETASSCLINCNGFQSCQYSNFLLAASDSVMVNCNGTSSCDHAAISCGVPDMIPIEIQRFTKDEFDAKMNECVISILPSNAMKKAEILCQGSISNCIVDAYSTNSIAESVFDWFVPYILFQCILAQISSFFFLTKTKTKIVCVYNVPK